MSLSKAYFCIYDLVDDPREQIMANTATDLKKNVVVAELRGEDVLERFSSENLTKKEAEDKASQYSSFGLDVEREIFPEVVDHTAPHCEDTEKLLFFLQCAQKKAYQYFGKLMNNGDDEMNVANPESERTMSRKTSVSKEDNVECEIDIGVDQEASSLDSSY